MMLSLKGQRNRTAKGFKLIMAYLLAFLMLIGIAPVGVLAGESAPAASAEGADFMYLDGERIPLDDERIINVVTVPVSAGAFQEGPAPMSSQPAVDRIFAVNGAFARDPDVYMGTRRVSAQRYAVEIDGIHYEAFCADPALPGPESTGAVYELTGPAADRYNTVLRYGFPANPYFSQDGPNVSGIDDLMLWAYVTRVAVAMANNPNRQFTGDDDIISWAEDLVSGDPFWVRNYDVTHPAIMINGEADAEDMDNIIDSTDTTVQSETFSVTHNRRNHNNRNEFRFEWSSGTPAGAQLFVNGSLLATAPTNSSQTFHGDVSFHIQMPNQPAFHDSEAKVYLVGIHNAYANRVWLMQNPNDRENWQDIIFFIPYMRASATFSFVPQEDEGGLRIIKRNPLGRGLAGAVFEITGPGGFSAQRTTPANGVITLSGLEPGEYTVTETSPPPGHQLADPASVTVTIPPDSTQTIERIFINEPYTVPELMSAGVRIQKIDAITRENIPGALIRLRGMSAHFGTTAGGHLGDVQWSFNNTGINLSQVLTAGATVALPPGGDDPGVTSTVTDGVWTLEGLPFGFYMAEEERAPEGYSLLPQHTAFGFWLTPPNIIVDVEQWDILVTYDGVVQSFREVSTWDLPDEITLEDVVALLEELGHSFEVVFGFSLTEEPEISSVLVTFENYPFGSITATKFCEVTGNRLPGAHIRIQGYFAEGNPGGMPIDRIGITGADGTYTFDNLPAGQYTLSEIEAPPGFELDSPQFRSVSLTWGEHLNNVHFFNKPKTFLEVEKIDGTTGARLAGAVFTLTDPASGEVWTSAPTGANGRTTLGQASGSFANQLSAGRTYILREIQAPPGYVLLTEPLEVVLMADGPNLVVVRNYENPSLVIIKRDIDTQEPLEGAVFEVVFENGQTVQGSPFTTGSDGTVTIPWTLFEGNNERTLIITEIVAPPGYHLSSPNWQRVTMRPGEHNTVTFENARKPTITIEKRDAITGMPIANAEFTIEKITEPGRGMLTGNPFRTDATGRIVLPFQHSGRYRIVETRAATNYWLDPLEQNRSWIIEVRDNEDYLLIVENTLLPSLVITKFNALTHRPVPLTHFRVEFEVPNSGNVILIGNFVTNQNGQIILPFVQSGWYRVTETRPAPGMALNVNNNYRVFLAPGQNTYQLMQQGLIPSVFEGIAPYPASAVEPPDIPEQNEPLPPPDNPGGNPSGNSPGNSGNSPYYDYPIDTDNIEIVPDPALVNRVTSGMTVTDGDAWLVGEGIWNYPLNSIVIKKTDITNGRLLAGATFDLIHVSTGESGTRGTVIGTFTTNHSGIIVITGLEPGAYVVEETIPPTNFMLSTNNRQHAFLRPDGFSIVETHFSNYPFGSLLITLRCEVTGVPIQNGEFRVTTSDGTVVGTANGLFRTNQEGYVLIPNLRPDSYVVAQTLAPDGFVLGSVVVPQTIHVRPDGQTYRLEFTNQPLSTLIIRKIDSYDNSPIAGARYRVYRQDNSFVREAVTDNQGLIEIPGLLGWFTVREMDVPHGFEFDMQTVRNVQVQPHAPALVTFYSPRLGSLTIEAVDEHGTPLAGATFRVNRQNGELVGTHTTGASGVINIPNLTSGWYTVEATSAPNGFIVGEEGRSVEVLPNTAPVTRFVFPRLSVLTIEKVDDMGRPLAGATFEVRHPNGERISMGTTNNAGVFTVNNIQPGTVVIEETGAPAGFAIVEPARTVEFAPGQNRTERFRNYRLGTLVIENIDEEHTPLQGGRFRVTRPNGEVIGDYLALVSGIITIPNLTSGAYIVEQIAAPPGFVLSDTGRTVEVLANQTVRTTFTNTRQPSLTIEKVDEDGNPLQGAEFEVRRPNGELVARVVTNNGGLVHVPNLAPRTYIVEETRAPSGFVITEPARTIEIVAGQVRVERFVNHRAPSLVIEKVDEDGNPLAGAEFEVRRLSGELVIRGVTNQGGLFAVPNIEPGAYEVIETRAPAGFVVTEPSRAIEIVAGQTRTERFINHRTPSLTIEKVDEEGSPLAGAEFEIRRPNGELIHRGTTNNGGILTIPNIEPGTVIIEETRAPAGFVVTEPSRTIEMVAGQSRTERFVNYRAPALVVEKVDADGNPLANAEFEVRRLNGELIVRGVTNQGGVFIVPVLDPGAYEVIETRAPAGFVITEPSRNIQIVAGQTLTERFINHRVPSLTIEKVDEDGSPLAGAEFEIRRHNDELIHRGTTNNGGILTIPNIEPGTVIIEETRAPAGFVVTEPSRTIEMVAGQSRTERFVNYRAPALVVEKVDTDGNPLSGAEFEVRRLNGELIVRGVTNQGGVFIVPVLEPGAYEVIETRAPEGFVVTEPSRTIQIVAGQTLTERFINHRAPSLNVEKVDTDGNPLANAEFEVRRLSGELVSRGITNQGGLFVVDGLAPGAYEVIETRAPEGFVIVEPSRAIQIVAGQTLTERFVNYRAANLTIEKVDTDGNPLGGAEFEMRRPNGELIARLTTNNGGVATINNLEAGTIIIEETRAPQGFVISEPARTITITAGQNAVERFVNHRQPSLVIEKVDEDGNPLGGAEFEVRTLGGQLVHRAVTNQGGLITIPYLEPGSYQVIETRAPDGFVITEPARAIEIFAGQTVTERFINHRMPALIVEKVDSDGNPLSGATFEVRTLAGLLVERIVTNQGGMAIIHELSPGSHEITETIAPQGFALVEGSRAIQIVAGQTVTERFVNPRLATLVIQKIDGITNEPLQGVVFEVSTLAGERLPNHINNSFEFVTDNAGMIRMPNMTAGTWVITETRPLPGYMAAEPVVFAVSVDREYVVTVRNYRYPDYNILKLDGITGLPLAGVEFEIAHFFANGQIGSRIRNPFDGSFIWTTDAAGLIRIPNLEHGTYVAIETRPLPGYRLAEPRVFVVADHEPTTITIHNYRYSEWNIRKLDGHDNSPQAGVIFEVAHFHGSGTTGDRIRNAHDGSFEFVTDAAGIARIGALVPGTFIITETRPLPGFIAAESVIITVTGNEIDTTVTIRNYRYTEWNVLKLDGDTERPLEGVVFEIARHWGSSGTSDRLRNPVTGSFEFVTDSAGLIRLGALEPGTYIVTETRPLPGFITADPVTFVVDANSTDTTITIRNYRRPDFVIRKTDGDTGQPLAGVHFEVARYFGSGFSSSAGERLQNPADGSTTFITDDAGLIRLPFMEDGTFVAIETRALPGFILAEPVVFTVGPDTQSTTIDIRNYRRPDFIIRKTDGDTGQPLAGVHFEVARYFGSGNAGERLQNPADGSTTFITDNAGLIRLPFMEDGTFVAIETRALPGFILAEPVVFTVGPNTQNTTIDIRNYRSAQLTIRKINSISRAPLEGVVFEISRPDGTRLINPATGFHDFITDRNGLIFLPVIEDGRFYLRETRALPGFMIDEEVIAFNIDASARQREHVLVVENTPAAGLLIIARDAQTRRPLQGIEVEVRHADGRIVTGQLLDGNQPNTPANSPQMAANGNFVTDRFGRINLNHIAPGVYHVRAVNNISGYQFDTDVHVVTVVAGQQTVLELESIPLGGFRLLHVDSITGNPIFNAEFMIFDHNNKVVGNFQTDDRGIIDFSALLVAGRYTIRMTRPAPGYSRDDMPRTVEFIAGRVTEIVWEAIPIGGQLQILKVSGDANQHNGLPAGTPLAGAIFEIFEARTGNLVDRIISNERGMAVSRPLPLGRYIAVEVTAPAFYMINPQEIHFEIEHENQIVRVTFPNFSANVGVTIRKTGPAEVMQGHNIVYEIPVVRNDSSIPLADFFWRDTLPTNAVRVDRLVTGTYNHALRYRVLATTNRGNVIVVADNLSTLTNNVIEMRPVHLGLAADEFVVDFTLHFGQVPAGFTSVERPRVFVDVLSDRQVFLPDGMMFANKVDVGGRIPGTEEWQIGNSTVASTIFNPRRIPQSGF